MIKIRHLTFMHKKALPLFMVLCLVVSLMPSHLAFADANQLYFTSSTGYQKNLHETITVEVKSLVDSAAPGTGTATGTVAYPTGLLRVVGQPSTAGSAYTTVSTTPGNGTISFSASRNPDSSGIGNKIFTITFEAIGAGSGPLRITDGIVNGMAAQAPPAGWPTITITNPNPQPSNSSTPKPSTSSKPSSSPSSQPQDNSTVPQVSPDPTGLVDAVTVNPQYSSSTVTWKVNATNPKATLFYGIDSSQLDKQATVTKNPDGTFKTTITGLNPGWRYLFTIAATGDGNKNGAYSGTIALRGFPVTLTLTENNQPIQSGQVKIGNQTALITTPGKLTIGLAAGTYTGTITTETASQTINLTVATKPVPTDGSAPATQTFSFNLTSSSPLQGPGSGFAILTFIGVLFGGIVLLGGGFFVFMSYRRRRFEAEDPGVTYRSGTPTVVIDDGYDWKSQQKPNEGSSDEANSPITKPSIATTENKHHNSVYLDEEEPMDMFDKASSANKPTDAKLEEPSSTEHTPSSPHSTTP